jgi:hypothetical protein
MRMSINTTTTILLLHIYGYVVYLGADTTGSAPVKHGPVAFFSFSWLNFSLLTCKRSDKSTEKKKKKHTSEINRN